MITLHLKLNNCKKSNSASFKSLLSWIPGYQQIEGNMWPDTTKQRELPLICSSSRQYIELKNRKDFSVGKNKENGTIWLSKKQWRNIVP